LLHLALASILAFPVCYMSDTFLGVSHADRKGREEYHEDFFNDVYAVSFELTLRLRYLDLGWPGPPFWPAVVARFVRISAISASAVACAYPREIGDDQVSAQSPRSNEIVTHLRIRASGAIGRYVFPRAFRRAMFLWRRLCCCGPLSKFAFGQ
jgi:hypothetical protein